MGRKWLTRAEVRQRLGVPESTVRQWCAKGWLEERRVPGKKDIYVSAASAERMARHRPWEWSRPADPSLLTRQEAQEALGLGENGVRYLCATGELEERRVSSRKMYVTRASVTRLKAVRAARAAVAAARHRVAVLAAAGERQDLLEATAALVHRRADLTILEAGGTADG